MARKAMILKQKEEPKFSTRYYNRCKICGRRVLAHRAGEESLWNLDEEARRENLHFFSTFHREFTQALEE